MKNSKNIIIAIIIGLYLSILVIHIRITSNTKVKYKIRSKEKVIPKININDKKDTTYNYIFESENVID